MRFIVGKVDRRFGTPEYGFKLRTNGFLGEDFIGYEWFMRSGRAINRFKRCMFVQKSGKCSIEEIKIALKSGGLSGMQVGGKYVVGKGSDVD